MRLNSYYKWIISAFLHRGRPAPSCQGTVFLSEGLGHGTIRLTVALALERKGLLIQSSSNGISYWDLSNYGKRVALGLR
jgi:hypothetical protein